MKKYKNLWNNQKWQEFSEEVKKRNNDRCIECNRKGGDVVLQVHHTKYIPNKLPWEYLPSDCIPLCKGCHAREHGLIPPKKGWILVSVDDLGDLSGKCEREHCGHSIRYQRLTYHPKWGYQIVGSTCVHYLTKEDQTLSHLLRKTYQDISKFLRNNEGQSYHNEQGSFIMLRYKKYHFARIDISNENNYSFNLFIKEKGSYIPKICTKSYSLPNKNLNEVKELAFIALKGILEKRKAKQDILRALYKAVRANKPS